MSDLPNTLQGTAKKLVETHLHLVESIARGIASDMPKATDLTELLSLGRTGLVEAGVRYDPRYGASFATFATYRIRGAILDGIRKIMPMSRREWQRWQFQQKSNRYLEEKSAEKPKTGAEEADALEDIAVGVTAIFVTSFDAMLSRGEEPAAEQRTPEEETAQKELGEQLAAARKRLAPKEEEFLRLCYDEGLSLSEAGRRCGFTKGWASRLHAKIIQDLALEMGAQNEASP